MGFGNNSLYRRLYLVLSEINNYVMMVMGSRRDDTVKSATRRRRRGGPVSLNRHDILRYAFNLKLARGRDIVLFFSYSFHYYRWINNRTKKKKNISTFYTTRIRIFMQKKVGIKIFHHAYTVKMTKIRYKICIFH